MTERRELRPHVNVFVGREDIRWSGGLDAGLPEGAELVVLPSVSGG
jgi:molybdopterin converting factor small subunit